jgi:hypothetical protein
VTNKKLPSRGRSAISRLVTHGRLEIVRLKPRVVFVSVVTTVTVVVPMMASAFISIPVIPVIVTVIVTVRMIPVIMGIVSSTIITIRVIVVAMVTIR